MRLGTALISTIAALVLGVLIASANGSYETQSGDEAPDRRHHPARPDPGRIRAGRPPRPRPYVPAVDSLVERIWREARSGSAMQGPFEATAAGEAAFADILALPAQREAQRTLKARAVDVSSDVARTRLLLFEQADNSIPPPFLAVLAFWLAMIFASFSLCSRLNVTLIVALFIFALSASGAIFLILELSQPFAGLMQISSESIRHALAPL